MLSEARMAIEVRDRTTRERMARLARCRLATNCLMRIHLLRRAQGAPASSDRVDAANTDATKVRRGESVLLLVFIRVSSEDDRARFGRALRCLDAVRCPQAEAGLGQAKKNAERGSSGADAGHRVPGAPPGGLDLIVDRTARA